MQGRLQGFAFRDGDRVTYSSQEPMDQVIIGNASRTTGGTIGSNPSVSDKILKYNLFIAIPPETGLASFPSYLTAAQSN